MITSRLAVLIAEDETASRARLRQLIARHADLALAAECASGPETSAALRLIRPDIALLDIQMPGCDGFAALRRAGCEDTAVIFVTA